MDLVPVREGSVKGARFWRGWRTLDGSLSDPTIRSEGNGPGVSGGLPPGGVGGSASGALQPALSPVLSPFPIVECCFPILPDSTIHLLPLSSTCLSARGSPCFHTHSRCLPWGSVHDKVRRVWSGRCHLCDGFHGNREKKRSHPR